MPLLFPFGKTKKQGFLRVSGFPSAVFSGNNSKKQRRRWFELTGRLLA
jgi:hypothetical protein